MLNNRQDAINYFLNHYTHYLDKFKDFLRIASVSTDSDHYDEINQAAEWLETYMKLIGINNTKVFKTQKNPIVYGEYLGAGPKKPTVLIYGHYDVQPPDPLDQWDADPFTPVEKNECLYARGSSDMKGQLMISLTAIDSILNTGELGVNIKFIMEGEEEIGSPSIEEFLHTHKELLKSDFALNLDAGMVAENTPTIVYGLRGLAYFEIVVQGPSHDLHSGLFGGIVYNPAQALCEFLSALKDENGKVLLPGFYDDVTSLEEEEREELSRLPVSDQDLLAQTGVKELWGEEGYTSIERLGARPTLEIHGILTGYTGEGPKTVIPSRAMAKISTRLVPNQKPDEVFSQLKEFLDVKMPPYVTWEIKRLASDFPCIIDREFYATKSFASALETVFHTKPVYERGGGSIPIVSYMQDALGINSVLSGFALPDDRAHSPNEHIKLNLWKKGIETVIHFFLNLEEES